MFIIEIAKVKVKINNKYDYLNLFCKDYIIDSDSFDFEVSVTDEEILKEKEQSDIDFSEGYFESLCAYRKICFEMLNYDCFIMHAATIKIDNDAYLFLAKSGTGKTTHCRLLKEYLKDRICFINGDKPLIRIIDGIPYAFGTPWNGKERYGENTYAKIKALVFIERDINNSIIKLENKNILPKVIHQILIPSSEYEINKTFDLLNILLTKANSYLLKCNMELDAAICSSTEITK